MNNKQLQRRLEEALATLKEYPDDWNVTLMDSESTMFEMDDVSVSIDVEGEDIRFCADGTYCQ